MDELTPLRNLDPDTPGPSPAETAAAWARLVAAIDAAQPGASRSTASPSRLTFLGRFARPRFWAPAAAAAAVTAVAITGAVIAAPGPRPPRPGTSPPPLTAASVLLQAAAAAARQTPGHGPFFATEIENTDIYGSPPNPVVTYWLGDGVTGRRAWLNGRYAGSLPQALLFGYGFTWATLQRLPTAPGQLQADIVKTLRSLQDQGDSEPLAALSFSLIANLLARAPLSPALRSALYQVAARLPGLALVLHTHDLIGRPATEVYVNQNVPTGQALYFNPSTGAALDIGGFSPSPQCPNTQDAVLASGYVASKYQLPAGAVRTPRPVPPLSMFPGCGVYYTPPPSPGAASNPVPAPGTARTPGSLRSPTPTPTSTPTTIPAPTPTPALIPSPAATPRNRWTLPGVSWFPRRTPERHFVVAGPLFVYVGLRGLA